jgi:dTDP-4-amino-4,6-dideoxygalactose transaminase
MSTVARPEGGVMKVQAKKVQITDEIREVVLAQLESAVYYGGAQGFHFERELSRYLDVKYALAVNSGTSALLVAAMALGIGPGDEVLVPANVYDSSPEVPTFLGAVPIFCDVDEDTANVTAETLATRLTSKTRAIILTHLYGHPADMDPILQVARAHKLGVIEICAHAMGAEYKGKKVGGLADIGVFSLGSKNISVCGSGGAVSTNSPEWHREMTLISRHGWPRSSIDESFFQTVPFEDSPMAGMFPVERDPLRPGLNLQLDEIPCAIGRIGLRSLDGWNEQRRYFARLYTRLLKEAGVPVRPLPVKPWATHSYLHYVVRVDRRDALLRYLWDRGIETRVHYPTLLPELRYYREHFPTSPDVYPVARRLNQDMLTLPVHPWLADREVEYVVGRVADFYRG